MTKARTLADNFAADINGITAGTGITGGGTSGTVTVTNSMATEIDAKGDLVVGTGADTFSRLAVASTAGYLLSVDSVETTGLKWVEPAAAGGMTLLSTTTLTGSSVTISSINQSYTNLYVMITGTQVSTGSGNITLKFNAVSDSFWAAGVEQASGGALTSNAANAALIIFKDTQTGTGAHLMSFTISNYSEATFHTITGAYVSVNAAFEAGFYGGGWSPIAGGAAINDLVIATTAGSFNAGTVKIYGVK